MKVIIKEKEYDYKPDFPEGWVFSKGDYFKKVFIDGHVCFVKRFEVSNPENISGWNLMTALKGKNKENLVKLYDIVATTEKNKNVCYVFYEFIEGETLHKLISTNETIKLREITKDLFNAISSLHESGFWFGDFTEKNIFCNKSGKFILIDIDSAQPLQFAPDNDMWGDKNYWVCVLNFYKNILLEKNFKFTGINGISLNYLQLIFLILRIKLSGSDKTNDYFSSELFNSLPEVLNNQSPLFKKVFNKVQQKENVALQSDEITEIKNLIEDKIIGAQFILPNDDKANPIITVFNVTNCAEKEDDNYLVESKKPFTLHWKVKNAPNVELFKNDEFYTRFDGDTSDFALKETFDGKDKKIKFTLKASNSFSTITKSLMVTVTDNIDENVIGDVYQSPIINEFKAVNYLQRKDDVYLIENGKTFELSWNIKNALKIELFKNNKSIKIFNPQEKGIEQKEQIYDGIEKEIKYDIEASNNSIEIQRRPLTVKIISAIDDLIIYEFAANNYIDKNDDTYKIESGKSYMLNWKMQNAQYAELYKNGQLYKKLLGNEGTIEITEQAYDGRQREINYTLKASANDGGIKSESLIIVVQPPAIIKPLINYFKSNKTVLRNGGNYTLTWDVQHANVLELYKDEQLYKTFHDEKSISLKETYEGREKKIKYNLIAAKNDLQTKSNPVVISIKQPLNIPRILLLVVLPVVGILAGIFLYRHFHINPNDDGSSNDTAKNGGDNTVTSITIVPLFDSFAKSNIAAKTVITITGKNLPQNDTSLKVAFNNVEGQIISETNDSINVLVPALSSETKTSSIVVYYHQTAFTAANNVTYMPASAVTAVYPYKATSISPDNYITINGNNLPTTPGSIHVKFNDAEGEIKQQTKKSILAQVPELGNANTVKIVVYINGKLYTAANNILIRGDAVIDPFSFTNITAGKIIIISGKNFPVTKDAIKVRFNDVIGHNVSQTSNNVQVQVPLLLSTVHEVKITVYVYDVSMKVADHVPYMNSGQIATPPSPVQTTAPSVNLFNYVTCSLNVSAGESFNIQEITVQNNSNYSIQDITVELNFFKKDQEFKTTETHFRNIQSHSSLRKDITTKNVNVKLTTTIKSIKTKEFGVQTH